MLRMHTSAIREEQGEESYDFMTLFSYCINIEEGGADKGFYVREPREPRKQNGKLYVCHGSHIKVVRVTQSPASLHTNYVYILDTLDIVYIWIGKRATCVYVQKCRLFMERLRKELLSNVYRVCQRVSGMS